MPLLSELSSLTRAARKRGADHPLAAALRDAERRTTLSSDLWAADVAAYRAAYEQTLLADRGHTAGVNLVSPEDYDPARNDDDPDTADLASELHEQARATTPFPVIGRPLASDERGTATLRAAGIDYAERARAAFQHERAATHPKE
ncbi:hypothetical protein C5C31_14680 [Rathayibacter rathayi]|uniref:hypothetical protein n=1 Tax=Rathayibacter rathayi TaxID=33887 RepID=UPI000BD3505E|nr:hypothetical protein [Rathayibacter rathayi]MWV76026.1 hypothetical protein [Rathayibacter rathayi NCPPB 2980 = VKM Ac-1601]PPF18803.1 hypothetical protein C5C34_15385 [Rathayibacter rathayi]PPF41948.1 hypothetical protein C5C08_15590 [Rathayibacter rathayi]PPF74694.1 hypothetical protein C5C14_15460 [Rathayibacter rathayi]PPG08398.1 hypothetical protein C5C11_15765 [Rathayibacter rathayi]